MCIRDRDGTDHQPPLGHNNNQNETRGSPVHQRRSPYSYLHFSPPGSPNQKADERSGVRKQRYPRTWAGVWGNIDREFRTQRRPLNVAFVLRRTVEQETLYPAPPGGDRTHTTTASCSDRRRRRTARFLLGRIYGGRPPRSWRRCRCMPREAAPSRGCPGARAS